MMTDFHGSWVYFMGTLHGLFFKSENTYIESQTDSPFSMIKKPRMFVIIVD